MSLKGVKVLISSVIRTSNPGDSHGGIYVLDLETEKFELKLDWDNPRINWEGRGGERGLRGIVVINDLLYCASCNQIMIYDLNFNLKDSIENVYMQGNHEIFHYQGKLYITSTYYDSVLVMNLKTNEIEKGYKIEKDFSVIEYDPRQKHSFEKRDTFHINNVHVDQNGIYFSGTALKNLMLIKGNKAEAIAPIGVGSHNAHPYKNGVLFNNTFAEKATYVDKNGHVIKDFLIQRFDSSQLKNVLEKDVAKQGWTRGMIVIDNLLIIGYSPSTISIFDFETAERIKTINLTKDIRNAVHGLTLLENNS